MRHRIEVLMTEQRDLHARLEALANEAPAGAPERALLDAAARQADTAATTLQKAVLRAAITDKVAAIDVLQAERTALTEALQALP